MGISMILFAIADYFHSKAIIIIFWLWIRSLEGISASMIQTTSYSIVSVLYPNEKEKYLGIIEASMGLGLLSGPAVGIALYAPLGFKPTFYIIGGIFLLLTPLLHRLLPDSIDVKNGEVSEYTNLSFEQPEDEIKGDLKPITYWNLLSIRPFTLTSIAVFLALLKSLNYFE